MMKRFHLDKIANLKTLSKTYFEVKKKNSTESKYIINFDTLDKKEKIEI